MTYNVNGSGDAFVTKHTNNTSGYFTWKEAKEKFATIRISGTAYHLPSLEEWRGLFNDKAVSFRTKNYPPIMKS